MTLKELVLDSIDTGSGCCSADARARKTRKFLEVILDDYEKKSNELCMLKEKIKEMEEKHNAENKK